MGLSSRSSKLHRQVTIFVHNLTLSTIAAPVECPKQKHGSPGFSAKTFSVNDFYEFTNRRGINALADCFISKYLSILQMNLKHTTSITA